RGKSYFANTLLGRHDGFELGSSVNGCTKGIDIWDTPFYHEGKRVVIIDCEGIDDPNQEVPWANKLFILCLAISSTLIYNINGIIGRDDIEKLFLMTKIVSLIQPPNDYQYLPNLVVLLRDFQLDSPPDFVKYFLERLSNVNYDAAQDITKFFKQFKVYALPSPGIRQDAMRDMSKIETNQLDPSFVKKIEEIVTNIFENLPPKYLNASTMTGIVFAEFLERCVVQINDPENTMLSIPSAYEATINYAAQKAYETCLETYNEMMNQISITGFPISWNEFEDIHNVALEIAMKTFIQQIVGSTDQIQSFQETFFDKITTVKDQLYMKNSAAMYEYHKEWAQKLWKENVAHGLEIEKLFDMDKFEEAIKLFERTYGTIAKPGQEAVQKLLEEKVKNMEDNLRSQEQHSEQAINQLKNENQHMLNKVKEESQLKINSLQEQLNNNTQKKTDFLDLIKEIVCIGEAILPIIKCFLKKK
ncbi:7682_t:CDS:2, partial [Scutellospora calospora]